MAFVGTYEFIFMSILLVSTISLTSCAVNTRDISYICSGTTNPKLCYQIFKSDPNTGLADPQGLAGQAIALASAEATKMASDFNRFAYGTSDCLAKYVYMLCQTSYNDVCLDLDSISNNLTPDDYKHISTYLWSAYNEAQGCADALKKTQASGNHAHIEVKNEQFQFYLSMVKATMDNLDGYNTCAS